VSEGDEYWKWGKVIREGEHEKTGKRGHNTTDG
jgi:hypothetical protein